MAIRLQMSQLASNSRHAFMLQDDIVSASKGEGKRKQNYRSTTEKKNNKSIIAWADTEFLDFQYNQKYRYISHNEIVNPKEETTYSGQVDVESGAVGTN